jgi:hypothetical protein
MADTCSRRFFEFKFGAAVVIAGLLCGALVYAQAPQVPPSQSPSAKTATPRTAEGRPDLSGIWVPTGLRVAVSKFDEAGSGETVFAAREGSFENFENDNALRRLGDRNKPLYKPEFWAKVRENEMDNVRRRGSPAVRPRTGTGASCGASPV